MRQERELPTYRTFNIKIPLDVLDKLVVEARRQERSLTREMIYRLRHSFDGDAKADAA